MARAKGRSPGSKINSKGRTSKDAKHVRLYAYLLDSPAYMAMSGNGRAILIELMHRYNGTNNGKIGMSVRDGAKRLGVSVNTATKALRELHDKGFACPTTVGSFKWKVRHATEWALTMFPIGDSKPTKEFMCWESPQIQKPVSNSNTDSIKN